MLTLTFTTENTNNINSLLNQTPIVQKYIKEVRDGVAHIVVHFGESATAAQVHEVRRALHQIIPLRVAVIDGITTEIPSEA